MIGGLGILIGSVILAVVVIGYVIALARSSGAWFWGTMVFSIVMVLLTYTVILNLPWIGWDSGLALIYFSIAAWLPAFVLGPLIVGVVLALRSQRESASQ